MGEDNINNTIEKGSYQWWIMLIAIVMVQEESSSKLTLIEQSRLLGEHHDVRPKGQTKNLTNREDAKSWKTKKNSITKEVKKTLVEKIRRVDEPRSNFQQFWVDWKRLLNAKVRHVKKP